MKKGITYIFRIIVDEILGECLKNLYAIFEKKVNRLYSIYIHSIITLTKQNRFFIKKKNTYRHSKYS